MILRNGQKELVEQYRKGYCAIPAIPGGGKTHSLCLWVAEMIEKGFHKPGKILIVTYMNSAVNNFKRRISGQLKARGLLSKGDFFVSTIHGLCMHIIREKPDAVLTSDEFEIIGEELKYDLLSRAVDEWKRNNVSRFKMFLEENSLNGNRTPKNLKRWQNDFLYIVSGAIGDFKCKGIKPEQALRKCRKLPGDSILKCVSEIYGIYDRNLKTGGFLDFDDMLFNAKNLLERDKSLLDKYRERYTFVCEDEAQDSNLIQSEILTLIADGNLLRVGDSNQAICGTFTNSDFSYFRNFCSLKETTVYTINQSSRSTREIIDIANYFVKYVNRRHPVPQCRNSLLPQYIQPVAQDDPFPNPVINEYGIKVKIFKSWEEEAEAVIRQAEYLVDKYPDKTTAILVPVSYKANRIVSMLEARNIKHYELGSSSREFNRPVRIMGRMLDYVCAPYSAEKLVSLLMECLESKDSIDKQALDELAACLKKCSISVLLYPKHGSIDTSQVPEHLRSLKIWAIVEDKLSAIKEILEFPTAPIEELILFAAQKLEFGREEIAVAQKIASEVRYMKRQEDWNLERFASDVLLKSRNMFNYFCSVVWELKGYQPEPGVIAVSTYHKAKGMEWDHVFLTSVNYDDFPVNLGDKFKGEYWYLKQEYRNPKALIKADMNKIVGAPQCDSLLESKLENISEKARLLYVGITRAKQRLFLSGVCANKGRKNEILPSRYLLELKKYVDSCLQVRGPEED